MLVWTAASARCVAVPGASVILLWWRLAALSALLCSTRGAAV